MLIPQEFKSIEDLLLKENNGIKSKCYCCGDPSVLKKKKWYRSSELLWIDDEHTIEILSSVFRVYGWGKFFRWF